MARFAVKSSPTVLFMGVLSPSRSATSWSIVCRGELMFSSAPRKNNAHWHMKTLDLAGRQSAVRSRLRTTSRTWGPVGGERLKRDICFVDFLTTKRWAGAVWLWAMSVGEGASGLLFLHVALVCFHCRALQGCARPVVDKNSWDEINA